MKSLLAMASLTLMLLAEAGCTALSLERHTANQAITAADMRYQLVMDTLARVSANAGNLPGLGIVTDGQITVTDSASFDARTALDGLKGFTSEMLNAMGTRSPNLQWTIDTTSTEDQVVVAWAACLWVITGVPPRNPDAITKLKYFQVYDDLVCLTTQYPGWICTGCESDVPKKCCHVAHHCGHYCWVARGGLRGLSEFTLILADIATISPPSLFGQATVKLTQPLQPGVNHSQKGDDLTTLTVYFKYNETNPKDIDFVNPIVAYGVPNSNNLTTKLNWAPPPWCGVPPVAGGPTPARLPSPSGANPSYQFHQMQQLQNLAR
jgi:hypothetical protein